MDERLSKIVPDLEIYLLRTLPRFSTRGNLQVRIKKIQPSLENLQPENFPAACLLPIDVRIAGENLRQPITDVAILGFSQSLTTPLYQEPEKSSAYQDPPKDWLKPTDYRVGFRWQSTWSAKDLLGKRVEPTAGLPRHHQVWLSRFGIEIPVPSSEQLNQSMQGHLDSLDEFSKVSKDQEFEVILDEVTSIWEFKLFGKAQYPLSSFLMCESGSYPLQYSDPFPLVHYEISEGLQSNYWKGNLRSLSILKAIMESVWRGLHCFSPGWSAVASDPEENTTFTPILKLKTWSEAVYDGFYYPLLRLFCPELINQKAIEVAKPEKLSKNLQTTLKEGFKFFQQVSQMNPHLHSLTTEKTKESLMKEWIQLSEYFVAGVELNINPIRSINSLWPTVRKLFEEGLTKLNQKITTSQVNLYYQRAALALPNQQFRSLHFSLMKIQSFYKKSGDRNKLFVSPHEQLFTRTIFGNNLLQSQSATRIFGDASTRKTQILTFAQTFGDRFIFMFEDDRCVLKDIRFCILWKDGTVKEFRVNRDVLNMPTATFVGSRRTVFWNDGILMILLKSVSATTYCISFNFKHCVDSPQERLLAYCRPVMNHDCSLNLGSDLPLGQNVTTFIKDTLYWINLIPSSLPQLWTLSVDDQGVPHQDKFDWTKHFSRQDLDRLSHFNTKKVFTPFVAIASSSISQKLYLAVLKSIKPGKGKPVSNHELTIAAFKRSRIPEQTELRFLAKGRFVIKQELFPYKQGTNNEKLCAKILQLAKRDFFMLHYEHSVCLVFGLHQTSFKWYRVNSSWNAKLPELPGTELRPLGLTSHLLSRYSYTWNSFMGAEKKSLAVYYRQFYY